MSILLLVPGCGIHCRLPGAQGKIESNGATGSCAASVKDAVGGALHCTAYSKTLSPSNGAPRPAPSSIEPTKSPGLWSCGRRVPSMSGGGRPSPGGYGGASGARGKLIMRECGAPLVILC